MPKKNGSGGHFGIFYFVAELVKIEKGTLWWNKIFGKKSHIRKGDPLVLPGNLRYAEKKKPFWFSPLGQQVKFEML